MAIHRLVVFNVIVLHQLTLLPANAAASATPVSKEFDVKGSHASTATHDEIIELNTSKKLLTTPPSKKELKDSYFAAEQEGDPGYALIALCAPYRHHNPDIFALTVFKKFIAICCEKDWFKVLGRKLIFNSELTDNLDEDLASQDSASEIIAMGLYPIFWCCLGIVKAYSTNPMLGVAINRLVDTATQCHKVPSTHYMWAFIGQYNTIERAHKKYWDAQTLHSQVMRTIDETVPVIPREIAQIITQYYLRTQFGDSVGDALAEGSILPAGVSHVYSGGHLLISSLQGIRGDAQHAYQLVHNIISEIVPTDLMSCSISKLNLAYNRVTNIPPGAFMHLEELNLNGNQLIHLTKAMFAGCNLLHDLRLSHNAIGDIEEGTLAQLPRLRSVTMPGNKLRTLPVDFVVMANRSDVLNALRSLELEDNPFLDNPAEKEKYNKLKAQVTQNDGNRQQALMAIARAERLRVEPVEPSDISEDSHQAFGWGAVFKRSHE